MKIFGTDGIRGLANKYPMTSEIAMKVGMAAALYLGNTKSRTNRVVIGKDTRLSGYMIENSLVSGLTALGKNVLLLGPIPTPAVAMLTKAIRADLGIMVSASHNPYYDNGIKLFDHQGYKMSDEDEKEITKLVSHDLSKYFAKSDSIGRVERLKEGFGRYIEYVKSVFPDNATLSNFKIVVDCANGAAYKIAPLVFYELGAEVIKIGVAPNGLNINDNCGSTHIETLKSQVLESKADLGIAFDGDADRVIMVDEKGEVIDGDLILAIIATRWQQQGMLSNNKIVSTVMANMGFEEYLKTQKIELIRTAVGDRYVNEALMEEKLSLGGEQSGHIIIPNYSTTGDGILASLEVLAALAKANKPASVALRLYTNTPQSLHNIKYSGKNPLENKVVQEFINNITKKNKELARIVIRKSGTENMIRIMVEAKTKPLVTLLSKEITNYFAKFI